MAISNTNFQKGRGAQKNADNPFSKNSYVTEHIEGLDEAFIDGAVKTTFFTEHSKKIINKIDSPDLGLMYSMNPYQGCEHGCIYCYARNTHQYWGYSAGVDFESKIIVKKNAAILLAKAFDNPIVTEITAATKFYKAEDYHQNYYNQNGDQPYCSYVIQPKLDKFRKVFHDKLKTEKK